VDGLNVMARYNTLPLQTRFHQQPSVATNDILPLILRGQMMEVRDLARFPALEEIFISGSTVPLHDFSSVQLELARQCLAIAADHIEADQEAHFHRHQGTWLLLRGSMRCSLTLLGMALQCQIEARNTGSDPKHLEETMLPPPWKKAVDQTSQALEYWSDESIDVARLHRILKELQRTYDESCRAAAALQSAGGMESYS
jgi:hypothetical protein